MATWKTGLALPQEPTGQEHAKEGTSHPDDEGQGDVDGWGLPGHVVIDVGHWQWVEHRSSKAGEEETKED